MTNTSDCRLLACPPEMRNLIYSYVLTFERPLTSMIAEAIPIDLAFLRVCKAVEHEAAPLLYRLNRFVFQIDYQHRYDRRTRSFAAVKASGRKPDLSFLSSRHINSLRNVVLVKKSEETDPRHTSFVPLGSTSHNVLIFSSTEIKETINTLTSKNTLLKSLSITLNGGHGMTLDGRNALDFLSLLNLGKGVFQALRQITSLKSLELWHSRYYRISDDTKTYKWMNLDRTVLEEVKSEHFPRAIALSSARRTSSVERKLCRTEDGLCIKFAR